MKKVGVILGRIRKMLLTLQPRIRMGVFQSGQMGQTVNLLSFDFGGIDVNPARWAEDRYYTA